MSTAQAQCRAQYDPGMEAWSVLGASKKARRAEQLSWRTYMKWGSRDQKLGSITLLGVSNE